MSQSVTVLSLVPLSDVLGVPNIGTNWIVNHFRSISNLIGFQYTLKSVLIFMVLSITLIALIDFFTKSYSAKASAKLVRRLRMKAISAVLNAKWHFYTGKKSGEFVHSIITEAGKTSAGYIDTINFFSAAIQGFVILLSIFLIDFKIAIAGSISGLLIIYIFKGWVEKARIVGHETSKVLQSITEIMADGMNGMKPLKAMNRDYLLAPLLNSETKNLELLQYRIFIVTAIPQILRGPIIVLIMALGLYIIVNQELLSVVSVIPMALLFQRSAQQFGNTQIAYQSIKKMEPFMLGIENNIRKAESLKEEWPGKEKQFLKKK